LNRTKIEYLDWTWNPAVGCDGFDCAVKDYCWARAQAKRRKHVCDLCYKFIPHMHKERLEEPFEVKKPSMIGVCFMGDVFSEGINQIPIFDVIRRSWHTFLVLTKQAQNLPYWRLPENLWLGVSVNRRADLWRIEKLKETHAAVKFVSFEPLYEDLDKIDLKSIDWIVIGAQTRPDYQPDGAWIDRLIIEAAVHKTAVFMKNNLRGWNPHLMIRQFPESKTLRETWNA
jgi:protein gp37